MEHTMNDDVVPGVWWKPADARGPACLSIEANGQKAYRRIWQPGTDDEYLEWGWVLADTAIPLKASPE
jgi:hypothetical protein